MNHARRLALLTSAWLALAASADEPEPPRKLSKLSGHENFVVSVAVSPDGKRVVSGGDDVALRFWDAHNGKAIRSVTPSYVPVQGRGAGALTSSPAGTPVRTS